MHQIHPPHPAPALARFRAPIPSRHGAGADEPVAAAAQTVHLTAEQVREELAKRHGGAPAPASSSARLYVGLGLGAILLAVVAFLIANPQLPAPPPAPQPLPGYSP